MKDKNVRVITKIIEKEYATNKIYRGKNEIKGGNPSIFKKVKGETRTMERLMFQKEAQS